MIKFEAATRNFNEESPFIAQRASKSYTNIYTLASNLEYSKEASHESTQLGNTVISIF